MTSHRFNGENLHFYGLNVESAIILGLRISRLAKLLLAATGSSRTYRGTT